MQPLFVYARSYVGMLLGFALISCGEAEFHGLNGSKEHKTTPRPNPGTDNSVPVVPNDPANPGNLNLSWKWECNDSSSAPSPTSFVGPGPHNISLENVTSLSISTDGIFCEPQRNQRDIMFIVDVSDSMVTGSGSVGPADAPVGNTCARLQTVQQVIEMASSTDEARFSTVTFSALTQQTSMNYHTTQASMFSELLTGSGSGIDNILCAGLSGTSYSSALTSARTLLNKARATATKEIYFISDGAPAPTEEGRDIALEIRKNATIVTVMLGAANDAVLKNDIATKDPNGLALHARANNAAELANIVKRMARNGIRGGKFKYRTVGAAAWKEIDMTPHINDGKFNLPTSALDIQGAKGVEVEVSYWDLHNRTTTKTGILNFSNLSP